MADLSFLEVGPRDGLQNEKKILSLKDKIEFVLRLAQTGLTRIELGAFVSPRWVPQMAQTKELAINILTQQNKGDLDKKIRFSALVPNQKGLDTALSTGLKEITIFLSATESFSQKNLNQSQETAFNNYQKLCQQALKEKLKIRAYLSVCFECPFEGSVDPKHVLKWTQKIEELGVYEISISDTTGRSRPQEVNSLLQKLFKRIPKNKLAVHFHNNQGLALANAWLAYQEGIRSFDGSVSGLGGCPYSLEPSGNVATEDLIYLFKGKKDPRISKLKKISPFLKEKLKNHCSSKGANSLIPSS